MINIDSNISHKSGQIQDSETKFKQFAKDLNTTFISTIKTTSTYNDSAFHTVNNSVTFVKKSTDLYSPKNIKNKTIMFMGPSGAGKSTLMNYICGVPMMVKDDITRMAVIPRDPSQSIALVGAGDGSTTFLPNIFSPTDLEGYQDTTFVDCPGDFDSNGGLFEMLNELSKEKIGNSSCNLKIVLLFPQSSFTSAGSYGGGTFVNTLKKIQVLVGNIIDLKDNIFMVVSHSRPNVNTPTQVEKSLQNILANPNNELGDFQIILKNIVENKRFSFMCTPSDADADGEDYNPPAFARKQAILSGISSVGFFDTKGSNRFKATASPGVYELTDGIQANGKNIIGAIEIVCGRIMNYFKTYFAEVANSKIPISIQDQAIITQFNEIKNIKDIEVTFLSFINELIEKIKKVPILPKITDDLYHSLSLLDFLWKFSAQVNLKNSSFKSRFGLSQSSFDGIFSEINSLKETQFSTIGKKLVVRGCTVRMSEVVNRVSKEMTDITIIAFEEFIFDRDYLQGENDNIAIYSPIWTVTKPVTINLSGEKGEPKEFENNYNTSNGKGIPGAPGQGGGNFYGVGEKFNNINQLTVISNGGDGGNGTNGKQGAQDDTNIYIYAIECYKYTSGLPKEKTFIHYMRDFVDANHTTVPKEFKGVKFLESFHKWFFSKNDINNFSIKINNVRRGDREGELDWMDLHCTVQLTRPGKRGDVGGVGGVGGKAGNVIIFNLATNASEPINKQVNNGSQGKSGSYGTDGATFKISCEVILAGHIYVHQDTACDFRCQIRSDQTKKSTTSSVSIYGDDGSRNNEGIIQPTPVENNYVSSRQDFIDSVFSTNLSFKNIDILGTPFLQSIINRPSTFDFNEIIARLISIETNYSEKHSESILSFYNQLKKDLSAFVQTQPVPIPIDMISAIKRVYQLICSGIFRYKTYKDSCIVVDMKSYLTMIDNNINELEQLRKTNIVEMYKKEYNNTLQGQIQEALNFVDDLQSNIVDCEEQLATDSKILISESEEQIEDIKKENEELEDKKSQLKSNLGARLGLQGLKICVSIAGAVLGGPEGVMIAGLVNQGIGMAGDLAIPGDPDVKSNVNKNVQLIDANLANKALTTLRNSPLTTQKLDALEFAVYKKQYFSIPNNPAKWEVPNNKKMSIDERIENLNKNSRLLKLEEKVVLKQVELGQSKLAGKSQGVVADIKTELKNLQSQMPKMEAYQLETIAVVLNTTAQMIKDGLATKDKVEQIDKLIAANKQAIDEISRNIYELQVFLNQQIDDISSYLNNIDYKDQSSVGLFVTKFQTNNYLKSVKSYVEAFPKSEKVQITETVNLLKESCETIVALYDKVQVYKEQQAFARYISDVTNAQNDPLNNLPKNLRDNIQTIINLSGRNLLVDQFNRAKTGFVQWCFPFSSYYLEGSGFKDPNTSNTNKTQLASDLKVSINNLLKVIEMDQSTITSGSKLSPDRNIMKSNFNATTTAGPFFHWYYSDYIYQFNRFLRGEEITLVSDATLALFDVTKFSQAFLTITIDGDEAKNTALQAVLNKFQVSMTHSGVSAFKFNSNVYKINATGSRSGITLIHEMNNPDSYNQAYQKLGLSKPILSPYTVWKFRLSPTIPTNIQLFESLSKFEYIKLSLNGVGTYFNDNGAKKEEKEELASQVQSDYSNNITSIVQL